MTAERARASAPRQLWRDQSVGDTGALAASKYASAGLGMVTTVVAARGLGPDEYGVAILAIGFCELLFALASFKTVAVATHYISSFKAKGEYRHAAAIVKLGLLIDVGMGSVTALAALASVPWLAPWIYQRQTVGPLIAVFAISLPFLGLVGTSTAALTAVGQFRWLAVVTVLDRFLMLTLVATALWLDGGVRGYILARTASQVAVGLILVTAASRALARAGVHAWWRASIRQVGHLRSELRSFFGWSYISGTCTGLMNQVPLLLLGRFADSASAGFYSVARSIFTVTLYIETSLGQIVYPKLSAASTRSLAAAIRRVRDWTVRGGLPTAVAVVGAIVLLPLAVPILLGESYVPVVGGSQILMFGAIVSALVFWLQPLYYSYGRIGDWTKGLAVDAVLVIGLTALVVPAGGWIALCWLLAANRIAFRLFMAYRIIRAESA